MRDAREMVAMLTVYWEVEEEAQVEVEVEVEVRRGRRWSPRGIESEMRGAEGKSLQVNHWQ